MDILLFSFNGVAPICAMVLLGMVLRRMNLVTQQAANAMNKLCFQVFIPCKIFSQIARSDLTAVADMRTIAFALASTMTCLLLLCLFVPRFLPLGPACGEFIQGTYRSNSVMLGLQLLTDLYGEPASAALALPLPVMMIFYNFTAPLVLIRYTGKQGATAKEMLRNVVRNPFLVAAVLGLIASLMKIPFPPFVTSTLDSLGAVGSPLGLIALGAVTQMDALRKSGRLALLSSLLRLVVIPLLVLPIGIALGIRGAQMAVLLCFFCTPTAIGGYVLAQNIDGDGELAGQILLQTTILSSVTLFVTIALLRGLAIL